MILFDFFANNLIADVPFSVIIPCVSSRVKYWLFVLRDWMICEAQFDLIDIERTLRSFC
jgi:hypothetical protein